MHLALNTLKRLICPKTQQSNQPTNSFHSKVSKMLVNIYNKRCQKNLWNWHHFKLQYYQMKTRFLSVCLLIWSDWCVKVTKAFVSIIWLRAHRHTQTHTHIYIYIYISFLVQHSLVVILKRLIIFFNYYDMIKKSKKLKGPFDWCFSIATTNSTGRKGSLSF